MNLERIKEYMKTHPEMVDDVRRAYFAYHAEPAWHVGASPGAHWFSESERTSVCQGCGRTRELVRWGDGSPECSKLPAEKELAHDREWVMSVLREEEERFLTLLERADQLVIKTIEKKGLSGDTLAFLHHSHGIDPDVVDAIVPVTDELRADYLKAWAIHITKGGRA